jgi:hypothetical protein
MSSTSLCTFYSPPTPADMDWSTLYPNYFTKGKSDGVTSPKKSVEFLDVGCGYGGLLGKCLHNKLMVYL